MTEAIGISLLGLSALTTFGMFRYRVAKPHQYLVRTGLGIHDIIVAKQGFQWPFQTYKFIDMSPAHYSFELGGMSLEKIEFVFPGVFTIGPKNDIHALEKYVRLLENCDSKTGKPTTTTTTTDQKQASKANNNSEHNESVMDNIILGILEGETRALSSKMSIEEIFNNRQVFKENIIENIQKELDQFGLEIYNANMKELMDVKDSKYFSNLRQKKLSEAENYAKVEVAEAKKKGDIGQKEREAETRQKTIFYEMETVKKENENRREIEQSKASLEVAIAEALRLKQVALAEANNAVQLKEAELQQKVNEARIKTQTELLRAQEMSKTQVQAEKEIKEAEGKARSTVVEAEAYATSVELKAKADLFKKQKEAEGVLAQYNAQAVGIQNIMKNFNDPSQLVQYLMLEKGTYAELARENAKAIQGLQPKITVWETGEKKENNNGSYASIISDVMKMVPPLVSTIHDQTGIKPPGWIASLPNENLKK